MSNSPKKKWEKPTLTKRSLEELGSEGRTEIADIVKKMIAERKGES